MPLISTNVPELQPLDPPLAEISQEDIEEEIDDLENVKGQLSNLLATIGVYNLGDLFSSENMTEYEHQNGIDCLDAMKRIVVERLKELKG